jgi:hypothetical protein
MSDNEPRGMRPVYLVPTCDRCGTSEPKVGFRFDPKTLAAVCFDCQTPEQQDEFAARAWRWMREHEAEVRAWMAERERGDEPEGAS